MRKKLTQNLMPHIINRCPNCGAKLEIVVKEVQAELPGLIYARGSSSGKKSADSIEKKLDGNFGASLKSSGSVPLQKSDSSNDSNRIGLSEEDLIESIRDIVGEYEWGLNGQLWSCYFQSCPDALRYAVRKWNQLSPVQQRSIKSPPAWLTDRYKRARGEITKTRQRDVASG